MKISQNLPNHLTIFRIIVIPLIIITIYFQDSVFAHRFGGAVFILASITDYLDGYIAKKYNLISNFGRIFDPIADKVLVSSVLLALVQQGQVSSIPCIIILAREFIVSGLREFLAQNGVKLTVSNFAKFKTILQMTAISVVIIGSIGSGISQLDLIGEMLIWIAAALSVYSAYEYFRKVKI